MIPTYEEIVNGGTTDSKSLEKIALELEIIAANFRLMAERISGEKDPGERQSGFWSRN